MLIVVLFAGFHLISFLGLDRLLFDFQNIHNYLFQYLGYVKFF